MWYFDAEVGYCRGFVYGGCGGNRNTYPNCLACMSRCTNYNPYLMCRYLEYEFFKKFIAGKLMVPPPHVSTGGDLTVPTGGTGNNDGTANVVNNGGTTDVDERGSTTIPCHTAGNREWECTGVEGCCTFWPPGRQKILCSVYPDPKPCNSTFQAWYFSKKDNACHRLPRGMCTSTINRFMWCEKCMNRCSAENSRSACRREYQRIKEEENTIKQGQTPAIVAPGGAATGTSPAVQSSSAGASVLTPSPEVATQGKPKNALGPPAQLPSTPVLLPPAPAPTAAGETEQSGKSRHENGEAMSGATKEEENTIKQGQTPAIVAPGGAATGTSPAVQSSSAGASVLTPSPEVATQGKPKNALGPPAQLPSTPVLLPPAPAPTAAGETEQSGKSRHENGEAMSGATKEEENTIKQGQTPAIVAPGGAATGTSPAVQSSSAGASVLTPSPEVATQGKPKNVLGPPAQLPSTPVLLPPAPAPTAAGETEQSGKSQHENGEAMSGATVAVPGVGDPVITLPTHAQQTGAFPGGFTRSKPRIRRIESTVRDK
ncbi:hypothetical protein MRX96_015590 [Rhipicephalus microplus]